MSKLRALTGTILAAIVLAVLLPVEAHAIPPFARKYEMACGSCHQGHYPRLNEFGRRFRENGFQLPEGAEAPARVERTVVALHAPRRRSLQRRWHSSSEAGARNIHVGHVRVGADLVRKHTANAGHAAGLLRESAALFAAVDGREDHLEQLQLGSQGDQHREFRVVPQSGPGERAHSGSVARASTTWEAATVSAPARWAHSRAPRARTSVARGFPRPISYSASRARPSNSSRVAPAIRQR